MFEAITFYVLGGLILVFAVLVVTARSTIYSILFLIADFLVVALLYASMNSLLMAAIQVLVYAGGIVVLYLFVVILVNLKEAPERHEDPRRRGRLGGIMVAAVMGELAVIAVYSAARQPLPPAASTDVGDVVKVAMALYTDYLIPFEVASVLLLIAMVGAIILGRKEA